VRAVTGGSQKGKTGDSAVRHTSENLRQATARVDKRPYGPSCMSHPVFRPKLNAFLYVCQDQVSHIKRQIVE
jgi:hypothetical protein